MIRLSIAITHTQNGRELSAIWPIYNVRLLYQRTTGVGQYNTIIDYRG